MAKEENKTPIEIPEEVVNKYYDKIDKELLKFFGRIKRRKKCTKE